jgi:hypothetical protein
MPMERYAEACSVRATVDREADSIPYLPRRVDKIEMRSIESHISAGILQETGRRLVIVSHDTWAGQDRTVAMRSTEKFGV